MLTLRNTYKKTPKLHGNGLGDGLQLIWETVGQYHWKTSGNISDSLKKQSLFLANGRTSGNSVPL